MNIIEWVEGTLLHTGLFPAQTFVLKMAYGIPLSPTSRIEFEHPLTGEKHSYTEDDYRRFLIGEGRCHFTDESDARKLVLSAGRRSGKTLLTSYMALNAIRELVAHECPQDYFGFPRGTTIGSMTLSPSLDMAKYLSSEIATHIGRDEDLYARRSSRLTTRTEFTSDAWGKRDDGRLSGDLHLSVKSSHAKGLRGRALYFVGFDEMAYMSDPRGTYLAAVPSLAAFSPKDGDGAVGPSEGRFAAVSSPRGREGQFYDLFMSRHTLSLMIPTWEMNPTIPRGYYQEHFRRDPSRFYSEYGATFTSLMDCRETPSTGV